MITLTGTLGDRHKQLNNLVNEAARRMDDFAEVKKRTEASDIDKLFKIDLASKYKNVNYILDMLEAGDDLYIARALKSSWIYSDSYSDIINPEFLHYNTFPYMSLKMKRKMLVTIATHVKNPERAESFCQYCMGIKLPNVAAKFAINTPPNVRLEFTTENFGVLEKIESKTYFKHFIGKSFAIAKRLITLMKTDLNKIQVLYNVRHFYSLINVTYLQVLEQHVKITPYNNPKRLGSTISKNIIRNHKKRVLENFNIYVNFLHMKTLSKFITVTEAKILIFHLLPTNVGDFWSQNFCMHYYHLLNKLPDEGMYHFLESMFRYKYRQQPFESTIEFYNGQCYKLMTDEERQKWALDQIANQQEIHGPGTDYIFYKFVKFNVAFRELTKLIQMTTNRQTRVDMLAILLETVKHQRNLEWVLKYYSESHRNDPKYIQENFIERILNEYAGYDLDKDCWRALEKIFRNIQLYSSVDNVARQNFKIIAFLYYVLNDIDLPRSLEYFITNYVYLFQLQKVTEKLTKVRQEKVYEYLLYLYLVKVRQFHEYTKEQNRKYPVTKHLNNILDLYTLLDRSKDIPDFIMKFVRLDSLTLEPRVGSFAILPKTTQGQMMRYLKTDPRLAIDKFPLVKRTHESEDTFKLSLLLKKIKIYFSNDISKEYIELYEKWMFESSFSVKCMEAATYAIFLLCNESHKVSFMRKYAPLDTRNMSIVTQKSLIIRQTICKTMFYSRPTVPLNNILSYLRGQYIRTSLPFINFYFLTLPLPLCVQLIEAIVNYQSMAQRNVGDNVISFHAQNLGKIIPYIWRKCKNDYLRFYIYKTLYYKIVKDNAKADSEVFKTLIKFTLDLKENDIDGIFNVLVSGGISEHLVSNYMDAVWTAVDSLPSTSSINIQRKTAVIEHMNNIIDSLNHDLVRPIVKDFIEEIFDILLTTATSTIDPDLFYLYNKKWDLTGKYIIHVRDPKEISMKKEMALLITEKCLRIFYLSDGDKYVGNDLLYKFVRYLQEESYLQPNEYYLYANWILEAIMDALLEALPIEKLYFFVWEMSVDIATREAIINMHVLPEVMYADKNTMTKTIISRFGEAIARIIRDFINKHFYFNSLAPFIQNQLYPQTEKLANLLDDRSPDDILVITSLNLIQYRRPETILFALYVLPVEYAGCYFNDYEYVMNDLKNSIYVEVRTLFIQKFVNSGNKPKPFLHI